MTTHHFNVDEAKKHGVEAAIILSNIRFWIAKNKANERHFYQGRYWTYNSARAFAELFPYWSQSQIRRILAKLIADNVLVVGEFNSNPYDHTKWYALNEQHDVSKSSHRDNESATSYTDIKPDEKQDKPSRKRDVVSCPDGVSQEIWSDFIFLRNKIKAPLTQTALQCIVREAGKAGWTVQDVLQECIARGWRSFKAEWVTAKSQSTNFFGGI